MGLNLRAHPGEIDKAMAKMVHLPDDVVGMIYESVASNEPWQQPLEKLRLMVDASNLMLRIAGTTTKTRDAIFAYGPKVDQRKIADWEDRIYREKFPVNPPSGETVFFQWEQVVKESELIEYLRNYGSSWTAVHCFESASIGDCFLIGSREAHQEPFTSQEGAILRAAGKHFKRAVHLRSEFLRQKLTADFQGEGLDRLSISAFLIEPSGNSIPLNHAAHELVADGSVLALRQGRLCAVDEQQNRRLQSGIRQVFGSKGDRMKARAMALTAEGKGRGLGLVIQGRVSVSLASGKPDTNVMVFVRNIDTAVDIDFEMARELFGFTPAEARLAGGLAQGKLLNELEAELGISHNTARAHLRSMFVKADVNRQAQLVHLIANCVAPLGRS